MRYYNLRERRMVGPATAARTGEVDEIAEMREMLDNGIVEFTFTKADGSERHAKGTTSEQVVPVADRRRLDQHYDGNVASDEARAMYIIWFWDLEKNEVRCFSTNRFGEIINYERTTRRAVIDQPDDEVDQESDELTPERIAEINGVLDNVGRLISTGDFGDMSYGGSLDCNLVVDHGDPVIKINIDKKFGLDDEPYQLEIAELCKVVKLRFNVEIKRVEVTGVFKLK